MSNPVKIWENWFALSEAQNVIALRLMRMAAGGAKGTPEARRMVTEKFAAALEAQTIVSAAAMTGEDNFRATKKVMGVYKKRVRRNKRRLAR